MDTALITATIVAAAAVFAAVMTWNAAKRTRQSSERTHAWTRIVWAAQLHPGDRGYDISRSVLRSIATLRWAPEDDRELASELSQAVEPTEPTRPVEPDEPDESAEPAQPEEYP